MLRSSLCDYIDASILVKQTIIVAGKGANDAAIPVERNNKQVIFKSFAPFTDS